VRIILFIFLLSLFPTLLWAQSPLLPPSHPAYEFLDRMETAGLLDHPLMGSKPVSRVRIAELLDEAHHKAESMPFDLSRVDKEILHALRWEFSRDAERADLEMAPVDHPDGSTRWKAINGWMEDKNWFTRAFYRNGINLYSYESNAFDAYIDPRGEARVISQKDEGDPVVITAVGVRFRGHIKDDLGVYFEIFDKTERGRGPYWDRSQLYQDRTGYVGNVAGDESINYDVANFDLAVGGEFWELHACKMPLRWGPGKSGQLLLSDWGTSFHQLQARIDFGSRLRLVYVFGSLKTYPEIADTLYISAGSSRTIEANKFIAAHRLEWNPHNRFRIGFSEVVIFGEREPELAYLIPVNLFYSAQHDLGDEDNVLMSFDAAWIPCPRWRLYGELLIDDITIGKLGSDFYGNKLGWLGGVTRNEPLGLRNIDITLEMAQLRPLVYTNRYPVNAYTHWTSPLGYLYPPNSQTLFVQLKYRPHRRVHLDASFTNLRHGANTASLNAGGDLYQPHESGASDDAPFLGGDLQKMNRFDIVCDYEVLLGWHFWSRGSAFDFDGDDSWEWEVGFRLN